MSPNAQTNKKEVQDFLIGRHYRRDNHVTLFNGDCLDLLKVIPNEEARLVVTSPPYNIGKAYERKININQYLDQQASVIEECVRVLSPTGSICWQVGNYTDKGEIFPLDILLYDIFKKFQLKLRNRIIWHFEHGLHCSKRFSGRYETILWFTKNDDYLFDLDPVRIPQKYPGKKHYKGPKAGQFSCNPAGKNPGDLWVIPNVKHNHIEKTIHPCQFPVELIERLILSMTAQGDLVIDPFMGVGSTPVAAIKNNRRSAGADIFKEYLDIAEERVTLAYNGLLPTRPMGKEVYEPPNSSTLTQNPFEEKGDY
ncbi:MAG: site-specific DNA-methyltransferase [Clostridia bacterium]|uniref:DNA-methyltransferase n=1 Tax=Desulfosporosinus sp. TaxID=157907 RepID=UPI0023240FF6|nr:site-specific DNA-methyltransferase [Desulfosporosinus sp.]MDA8212379.1 site-specific DNA-methyltransferase [Clostridia bacterium]